MTTKSPQPSVSNFWTGFTVGATVLFFLGTKKGRITLKKLMDFAENLETNIDDIVDSASDSGSSKDKLMQGATNIGELITKIQSALPEKKDVKRFFAKSGKALKST